MALGALLRIVFVFAGGGIYYGRPDFFINGDSTSWFQAFINLWEHGTFTVANNIEAGKFFRPPGYSFLFGIFYLLSFKNYVLAWKLLVAAQVMMDTASIILVARITERISARMNGEERIFLSNLSALLFAIYPFAIVWAPVLYAETSSLFFMLLCIHFAFREPTSRSAFLSGLFGGVATLLRLQCAFGVLLVGATAFFSGTGKKAKLKFKAVLAFGLAVLCSYGLWPARNYFLQHRLVFSQDLNMGRHWSKDFMSFLDFTHSIGTDHTPYYRAILNNEKINWPADAYLDPEDSLLLDSAVKMCRTCGTGFAWWKWGEGITSQLILPDQPCDSSIAEIYSSLTQKQKSRNSFHYWITIPMQNLNKCFFKFSLYGEKSLVVKIFSSSLFIIRSALIFIGLFGLYLGFRNHALDKRFCFFVIAYVLTWDLYLSFFYRNMEMRYMLHTDVLLLIPAAFACSILLTKKNPITNV